MKDSRLDIARLRVVVGYLGEKSNHNWWTSEFFSATASAFLQPVFPKTMPLAQYHGVTEAARRVHDEHIGIGRVFHLFRLPESVEQAMFEQLQDAANAKSLVEQTTSPEQALDAIKALADGNASAQDASANTGPQQIGDIADVNGTEWLRDTARCYQAAFTAGTQVFPYLRDQG